MSHYYETTTNQYNTLLTTEVHGHMGSTPHPNPTIKQTQLELWFIGTYCLLPLFLSSIDDVMNPIRYCVQYCGVKKCFLVNFLLPYPMNPKEHWTDFLDIHLVYTAMNVDMIWTSCMSVSTENSCQIFMIIKDLWLTTVLSIVGSNAFR